jgi:mannose-6-phosphate isomerase-like protein (cupin superfamily)
MSGLVKTQASEIVSMCTLQSEGFLTMTDYRVLSRTTVADTYIFFGVRMKILMDSAQTGGQFCMIEGVIPPGGEPPMHVHLREDESMLQLDGELHVTIGDREFTLSPGHAYFAPRGVPHRVRNLGSVPARSIATMTPGGFDLLVRRLGIPVIDGVTAAEPSEPTPEQFSTLLNVLAEFGIMLPPVATGLTEPGPV